MIDFACPHCLSKASAPDEDAGRWPECPRCGKRIKVPASSHPAKGSKKPVSKKPMYLVLGAWAAFVCLPVFGCVAVVTLGGIGIFGTKSRSGETGHKATGTPTPSKGGGKR
jgi:uncharacterized paraquat-inducible protein A